MTTLAAGFVDAAIVLAIALIATSLLRRRSAALRHGILATAIAIAALMPAFEVLVPQFPVIRRYVPAAVVSQDATSSSIAAITAPAIDQTLSAPKARIQWNAVFAIIWIAGVIVTGAGLITALVKLGRIRSKSTRVTGRWQELADELSRQCGLQRHVALLQSADTSLLVTCGVLRPCIILPAGSSAWTDARVRIVIRHELAHVARHDAAIHIVSEVLRALQWVNPLVWIVCRRLRQESEQACDDVVLSGGVEPTEYATHLLGVARHLTAHRAAWAAPAIAHPSTLERRIVAMLNGSRNRAPLGRRGWLAVAIAALCVSVPLAAATVAPAVRTDVVVGGAVGAEEAEENEANADEAPAIDIASAPVAAEPPSAATVAPARRPRLRDQAATGQATGAIAGSVLDQSGGTMPGAQVTLTDVQTGAQMIRTTNAYGRFTFGDLPPARYELAVSMYGFAPVSSIVTLAPRADVQRTFAMGMGRVSETVTVACGAPSSAASGGRWLTQLAQTLRASVFADVAAQQPVRVGGDVRVPRKLTHVNPVCPPGTPAGDTTVRLAGRIGVDGFMNDVVPVASGAGAVPPALTEAALDAVRQWTFAPVLLNGRPVEVGIDVYVTFRRL